MFSESPPSFTSLQILLLVSFRHYTMREKHVVREYREVTGR